MKTLYLTSSKAKGLILTVAIVLTIAALLVLCLSLNKLYLPNPSTVLYDRDKNIIAYNLSADDKLRFRTNLSDIDPLYFKLLISSEDERFYYHLGVDPISIVRSFYTNFSATRRSGASTLAMQVAKLLLKNKERNLVNKMQEALVATFLTLYYGRESILYLYANLAPMGSNIEGVNAASLSYFSHSAKHLTPDEAALLVALPKSPETLRPDRHYAKAKVMRDKVLKKGYSDGLYKEDVYKISLKEALPTVIKRPESKAYNLLYLASLYTKDFEYYSFIEPKVQDRLLSNIDLFAKISSYREDIAAVAIDNEKHSLIGYIGGKDRFISEVDFARAIRSPGSTLKPFIYGLSFDKNIIYPNSIIEDKRKSYGTWMPENFYRVFKGRVSAQDALINSLNLPTLEIFKALGPQNFVSTINNQHKYLKLNGIAKLPIATGGCGASLLNLTELYTLFKNDGVVYPTALFYTKDGNRIKVFYNTDLKNKKAKTNDPYTDADTNTSTDLSAYTDTLATTQVQESFTLNKDKDSKDSQNSLNKLDNLNDLDNFYIEQNDKENTHARYQLMSDKATDNLMLDRELNSIKSKSKSENLTAEAKVAYKKELANNNLPVTKFDNSKKVKDKESLYATALLDSNFLSHIVNDLKGSHIKNKLNVKICPNYNESLDFLCDVNDCNSTDNTDRIVQKLLLGKTKNTQITHNLKQDKPYRIMGSDAARAIDTILRLTQRPIGFSVFNNVSYKTGTAFNYTDALAIGSLSNITIGIRTGRIDGRENPPHTGLSRAAPYLFYTFEGLNLKDDIKKDSYYLTDRVPKALAHFYVNANKKANFTDTDPLLITYPVDNCEVFATDNKVFVEIEGGQSPYTLFINDKRLGEQNYFETTYSGVYKIVVMDSLMQANIIHVLVKN